MAEVVLREELARAGLAGAVTVESAGTGDWHLGERMYGPARAELARRGYDGSAHRARQIEASWLGRYDLLLAMDASNLADLRRMARGSDAAGRMRLLRSFDPGLTEDDPFDGEVPDPYGGQPGEYARAFDLIHAAAQGAGRAARRVPGRAARRQVSGPAQGEIAQRLARLAGAGVSELRLTGSQHQARHYRATLADGRVVFVKEAAAGPAGALGAEARGWAGWARPGRCRCPAWSAGTSPCWSSPGCRPGRRMRPRPGGSGATWPGCTRPVPTGSGRRGRGSSPACRCRTTGPRRRDARDAGAWPEWYASRRLLPYLRRAADAGALGPAHVRPVEAVAGPHHRAGGPAEPPSRIHGDCWSGNVLWSGGRGWLIDPAAHGGHRETDLAMLALFGAPFLDRILASYDEAAPLAAGWRARVPLHQLHPLLVHACLFGAGYARPVAEAARAALAAG